MPAPASSACRESRHRAAAPVLRQLLFVAYLVEAGLVLLIVPWSGLWERNAFIQMAAAWIVDIARSGWARGAVSGIGLMLVGAGLAEAVSIRTPAPPAHRSGPADGHS